MKDNYIIPVFSFSIIEKKNISRLTKLQKLICKWFHITPEERYSITIRVDTKISHPLKLNDLVLMCDETKWLVVKSEPGFVELTNLVLSTYPSVNIRNGDNIIWFANYWAEGNGSPS